MIKNNATVNIMMRVPKKRVRLLTSNDTMTGVTVAG